ncbi:flagellar filament capping protein FliD [Motiliproteus sp. SC1-56]|uniref:flagellar filament capping protein FliD n=1 Tax=Motiliproteus sp. SC1-56 TaxID=2799565 RepID=UPI001A8E00E5|nr:flagellar filament capping protein FliD [Motiliproteus sp. SC1-56]
MPGILSTPGLGSGLDVGGIVNALVNAEGAPKTARFDQRQAKIQAELTAVGVLKGALSEFRSSFAKLMEADDFSSRSAASSDRDIATVSINEGAEPSTGTYKLEVTQLARSHKLISGGIADATNVGAGVITFTQFGSDKLPASDAGNTADGGAFSIDTSDLAAYDSDEDGKVSVEELKEAINNAEDNPGITATVINVDDGAGGTEQKLVFSADDTGLENAFEVATTGFTELSVTNLTDPADPNYAQDAVIKLDGQTITGSSNSFENAISGLTIDAESANPGETIDLSVSVSTGAVKGRIDAFVKAYNTLQETFASNAQADPDSGRSTALFADSMFRTIRQQVRADVAGAVESTSSELNALAVIGITTDASGKLSVDSSKLDDALKSDFDGIVQLFSSEDGIAQRLDTRLESYLKSSGTFESRTESLNDKLRDIDDQRLVLDERLSKLESRLLAQFGAMDGTVARLNATSNWLAQQLQSLPGVVRQTKS